MKKEKDSNPPLNSTQNPTETQSNPVEPYRSKNMDITDDDFKCLSLAAIGLLDLLTLNKSMALGIGEFDINALAEKMLRDPSHFKAPLEQLKSWGFVMYDQRTMTLWLPRFFDFHPKPSTPRKFSRYLYMNFERLPWSPVKQQAGRDLIKRAKKWGPEYAVCDVIIRTAIRKPRQNRHRLHKRKTHLRLIKGDLDK